MAHTPLLVSQVRIERILICSAPISPINSASFSDIKDPAFTTTLPFTIKSSNRVLPKILSERGSMISSPSLRSEIIIPLIVPQSSS